MHATRARDVRATRPIEERLAGAPISWGAELEELSHELQRASDPEVKEAAKELAVEASEVKASA